MKTSLKSRFILWDDKSNPLHAVCLFLENKPVSDHNDKISTCLVALTVTAIAHDIVPGNCKLISSDWHIQNHKLTKIGNLASTLLLKTAAQIIMTVCIDIEDERKMNDEGEDEWNSW